MNEENCCGAQTACCCPAEPSCCDTILTPYGADDHWVVGELSTPFGNVPVVSTTLTSKDTWGMCKVRFGIGRMNYKVTPGLYAVGMPNDQSPVLVSANYKLTFDALRKQLTGLDFWLLTLDTKGVNVWCAAGKGTFGTGELLRQIAQSHLTEIVSHRKLILPQLGAVGISAHEVKKQSGFAVEYGPVQASDLKEYLALGCRATENMRRINFTMRDRLVLTPMEFIPAAKASLLVFGVMFLLNLFSARPFGLPDFIAYTVALLAGTVATPLLLPFVPVKPFALKGWILGFVATAIVVWLNGWFAMENLLLAIGYLLALPSLSAYWAMNFTGSSTYTSYSGVMKEMKAAIPFILSTIAAGIVLVLIKNLSGL